MQNLYCISGLGADEKVFRCLDLSFAKPVFINWITPLPGDTLQSYAMRLTNKFITGPEPLILGLSLGGMLATEIAKKFPDARIVIISSAKASNELPVRWKLFKYAPVYKILPYWLLKHSSLVQQYFLGAKLNSSRQYVKSAIKKTDIHFYRWAIGAIITWQNREIPTNIVHLHGSKDRLLPLKFVKPNFVIKNGSHLMIIENAEEISTLLQQIFTEKNKCNELNLAL